MNHYADRIHKALAVLNNCEEATWQTIEELKAILTPRKRGKPMRLTCRTEKCDKPAVPKTGLCEDCLREYNKQAQLKFRSKDNETR